MKRIGAFILATVTVLLLLPFSAFATASTEGLTFATSDIYEVNKSFTSVPLTIEASVYIASGINGRPGAVIGNYNNNASSLTLEIQAGGYPRLYYVNNESGNAVITDIKFTDVDVRSSSDKWVHLAVTVDTATKTAHCYVDGELKQSIQNDNLASISATVINAPFRLGGDYRSGNSIAFQRGRIKDVALFSDVRTGAEISSDANGVSAGTQGLIAYYNLTNATAGADISDLSGNGYGIKYENNITWYTDKAPVTGYAYSFAVVGDTQKITYKNPTKLAEIYDWILANKTSKNIQYVIGLGDITDQNTDAEWQTAKEAITSLNGQIPYSLIAGNHDGSAKFNEYFAGEAGYTANISGYYEQGKIDNTYTIFKVGEVNYLLFSLTYGPNDDILSWTSNIIEANPLHRVIITTHAYMYRDGTTLDKNDVCPPNDGTNPSNTKNNGDDIWNKLVSKYENIFLVLSGHDPSEDIIYRQDAGKNGTVVTQMLIDPQGMDESDVTGMVAMLYFSSDGQKISVEWISTVKEQYFKPKNQFDIDISGAMVDGVISDDIEIKVEGGYIKWRQGELGEWKNLISVSDLKGEQGSAGVGISRIEKTATNGKIDTYTIYFTDNTTAIFTVTNGTNGQNGAAGQNGADGKDGAAGKDGTDGMGGSSGLVYVAVGLSAAAVAIELGYIIITLTKKKGVK